MGSANLWENIVQSERAPICAFDLNYRLIAFNKAHCDEFFRIYGYRVKLGDVFPDLFVPEQAAVIRSFMARALSGESFSVVEEFGDPNLSKPYWDIAYTPLRDEDGTVFGAFYHAQDISARLRAEAELEKAQNALRQAQKMEAVGQLTGGVAHDFNNLLTIMQSATEMLRRPGLTEQKQARYIDAIGDAVERASKVTQQLLAFARRQALRPTIFDVRENISNLVDMIRTTVGARIGVHLDAPQDPCLVSADTNQFDTAIINMAINARDAMNDEGNLEISVRQAGSMVAVTLRDTGHGIPASHLDQIFEPFFTTKKVGCGTGLGLSQVFGFARQSGGEIQVESQEGVGSCFTMYLPKAASPVSEKVRTDAPEQIRLAAQVLIVEDNSALAETTNEALRELGFETVLAGDAAEALQILASKPNDFDIVFSDVVMPGMTGLEMAGQIRSVWPNLPVILASGYCHVLAENGSNGFELLQKPYSIENVAQTLRRAIQQSRGFALATAC